MTKLILGMLLGLSLLAFTACGEKSNNEKAKDAATKLQEDAAKTADEVMKDADKSADDAKEELGDMMDD